jgi:hypothetical protein
MDSEIFRCSCSSSAYTCARGSKDRSRLLRSLEATYLENAAATNVVAAALNYHDI